jgi:hypothetical protein
MLWASSAWFRDYSTPAPRGVTADGRTYATNVEEEDSPRKRLGFIGDLAADLAIRAFAGAARALGQPYMIAQEPVRFWMLLAVIHGLMVLAGVVITVRHQLALRPAAAVAPAPAAL